MSERLSVLYRDKSICAFELTDENGHYLEDIRHEVREASQAGELVCPDCGQRMTLCAGAIVQPYFRHFQKQECTTTLEMRTKAGKRRYACRKALFQMVKNAGLENITVQEDKDTGWCPIMFDCQAGKVGYVYLDGKARNVRELLDKYEFYRNQGTQIYFFLNAEYKSDAKNITSDEAECARLNGGEIYYLNVDNNTVTFRKKYKNNKEEIRYFEERFEMKEVVPNTDGKITSAFLEHFENLKEEEKLKVSKVRRIPAEEGIPEEFHDYDFVLMDSLEEIWILPAFRYRMEKDDEAVAQRIAFVEDHNMAMLEMDVVDREDHAWQVANYITKHLNSWDWM